MLRSSRLLLPAVCALMLSACAHQDLSHFARQFVPRPTPAVPQIDAAQLQAELLAASNRISQRVAAGELNRLEAVDELNLARLDLVGENNLDNEVFTFYRDLTAQLQRGELSAESLRSQMLMKLQQIRESRRVHYQTQPPVFTNFLLQTIYSQPPLS